MSVGRKIIDPVNVIVSFDSAIDISASDYAAYAKDAAYDESKLVFVDGQKPTRFKIKPWTRRQKNDIGVLGNTPDAMDMAIRYTLVSVENYVLYPETLPITESDMDHNTTHGKMLKQDWIDRANMTLTLKRELMEHVFAIGELSVPL